MDWIIIGLVVICLHGFMVRIRKSEIPHSAWVIIPSSWQVPIESAGWVVS
jgi:hypothetical protein